MGPARTRIGWPEIDDPWHRSQRHRRQAQHMSIIPDDKNWTWVLERPCPDCGFRSDEVDPLAMGPILKAVSGDLVGLLADPRVADRPNDHTWSALEYGCHVRDVYRLYDYRLSLMIETDGAQFPNWDQDQTAIDDRYGEQDPAVAAQELMAASDALTARFATVTAEQLDRTGFRSDGAAFTISSFAKYFVHDPIHHAHDIRQGYGTLAQR
jgi:hypothetical protein